MGVRREPHVDAVRTVPELDESGIEIEIDARADRFEQRRVFQHPGDVDEHVGALRDGAQLGMREADGFLRPREEQRGAAGEREVRDDLAEVGGAHRFRERSARRTQRFFPDRLDEPNLVTQPLQPEHVLEHSPRRAALVRVGGDHSAHEDAERSAVGGGEVRQSGGTICHANVSSMKFSLQKRQKPALLT